MDYESRLSKVEAQLEIHQKEIERLHQAISELRSLMLERYDRLDLRINELRQHTDLSIAELRKHVDQQLQRLEGSLESGLSEVRREASVNMRWMMGMWLSTMGLIAGMAGRVFGLY